eukprot:g81090.t1
MGKKQCHHFRPRLFVTQAGDVLILRITEILAVILAGVLCSSSSTPNSDSRVIVLLLFKVTGVYGTSIEISHIAFLFIEVLVLKLCQRNFRDKIKVG